MESIYGHSSYYQRNRQTKVKEMQQLLKEYANLFSDENRKELKGIFSNVCENEAIEIFLSLVGRDLSRTYGIIKRSKKTAFNLFLSNL